MLKESFYIFKRFPSTNQSFATYLPKPNVAMRHNILRVQKIPNVEKLKLIAHPHFNDLAAYSLPKTHSMSVYRLT